ncbi:MAG: hypothetical protein GY771_02785 [bacterium]|nr:hypothetical protein [bacterium]
MSGGTTGGGEERIIAFHGGDGYESGEDKDAAREYVAHWEVRCYFRDLTLSPGGDTLALAMEQVVKPLPDEKLGVFTANEIAGFVSRADRFVDSGVYTISGNGNPIYLGPGKRVFAFPEEDTLIIDYDMVPARIPASGGDPIPLLPSDKYEYGWVPQADCNAEGGAVVTHESDEKADEVKNYVYELEDYRIAGGHRIKYVEEVNRAVGMALSPNARFVVVTMQTDQLGSKDLMVGSMEGGDLVTVVSGGAFLEFLPSGNGFFYYVKGEKPGRGDIFACGLNGEILQVTDTGDVVPPGFIR